MAKAPTTKNKSRKHLLPKDPQRREFNKERAKKRVRFNRIRVEVGLLSLLIAVLGWHLTTCMSDRKAALAEFKKSVQASRNVEEKTKQVSAAFLITQASVNRYLDQSVVVLEEVKRQSALLASASKELNDACNTWKETVSIESEALHELTKYYPIQETNRYRPDLAFSCQGEAARTAELENSDAVVQQLVSDQTFRAEFVQGENASIERNREEYKRVLDALGAHERFRAALALDAEKRQDSLVLSIWDCLRIPALKRLRGH